MPARAAAAKPGAAARRRGPTKPAAATPSTKPGAAKPGAKPGARTRAAAAAPFTPSMRDQAVEAKTGKPWAAWFALLDAWGGAAKGHQAMAAWLHEEHGVPAWWCQTVTVEYERARGLRGVGQRVRGDWEVALQRTVAAGPAEAKAAWTDARARARWLRGDLGAAVRNALGTARDSATAMGDVVRLDLPGPGGRAARLEVTFTPRGAGTAVRVQHTRLPTKAERERLKRAWAEALDALQASFAR